MPDKVKRARLERMLGVGEELAQAAAQRWVGREVDALFEQRERDGLLSGWTGQYIRLRARGPEEWVGRVVRVTPREAQGGELIA